MKRNVNVVMWWCLCILNWYCLENVFVCLDHWKADPMVEAMVGAYEIPTMLIWLKITLLKLITRPMNTLTFHP